LDCPSRSSRLLSQVGGGVLGRRVAACVRPISRILYGSLVTASRADSFYGPVVVLYKAVHVIIGAA
jgi:hypothetical protein